MRPIAAGLVTWVFITMEMDPTVRLVCVADTHKYERTVVPVHVPPRGS